jgi:hypothetical protein
MRWERACTPERLATEKLPNRWPRPTGLALCGVGGNELTVLRRISRRSTLARWARRANVAIGSYHEVSR